MSSLYLDYGADALECDDDAVEICERGMQVCSRWQFEVGMEFSLSFLCGADGGRTGGQKYYVEASVVCCVPCDGKPGLFKSTLLFIDLPEELRESLRRNATAGTP